jgi:DNA-binding transcriptional MerR regulator
MNFAWVVVAGIGAFWLVRGAATQMCQEEVQTRLTRLPYALLRLATARLPQEIRNDVADEWRAELAFVLRDTDGLPLTRLLRGTRYAMGLLRASAAIVRELSSSDEKSASLDGSSQSLFDLAVEAVPAGYRGPTACSAAGITYRQLNYWDRTGLVEPSLHADLDSGSVRLYSFRDILVLKLIKRLLDTGISLQQIRTAVVHLRNRGTGDFAQVTLMSDGETIYECNSSDEVVDLLQRGKGVFGLALGQLWQEIEGNLAELPAVRLIPTDEES